MGDEDGGTVSSGSLLWLSVFRLWLALSLSPASGIGAGIGIIIPSPSGL